LLGSLVAVIEAVLIPLRLESSGLTRFAAIQLFGKLTGMVLPFIFFPTALSLSLATNLIPVVAQSQAAHDVPTLRQHVQDSLGATAVVGVPVTAILLIIGVQLDDLLFHTQVPPSVFIPLVAGGFFLYFDITLSGVLRGLGHTAIPFRNDLISSVVEVGLIWILAARPYQGAQGVAIALAIGFFLSFIMNLWATVRITGVRIAWSHLIVRPLVAIIPAVIITGWWQGWALHQEWDPMLRLLSSLVLAVILYLAMWPLIGFSWRSLS
jgi:stage V sporulation protein B